MAISSFPFDGQATTEDQYSKLFRELQDTGVVGSYGGTDLACSSAGTSMQITVAAGNAVVRGHMFMNTANTTVTIGAAHASLTRIDLVILHLDPSANSITLIVLPGTASSTPVAPTLTQTDTGIYEIALATVTVSPGVTTISAGSVADSRIFAGSRVGAWRTATRPVSPRKGQIGLNVDTGLHESWNGTAWKVVNSPADLRATSLQITTTIASNVQVAGVGITITLPSANSKVVARFTGYLKASDGLITDAGAIFVFTPTNNGGPRAAQLVGVSTTRVAYVAMAEATFSSPGAVTVQLLSAYSGSPGGTVIWNGVLEVEVIPA